MGSDGDWLQCKPLRGSKHKSHFEAVGPPQGKKTGLYKVSPFPVSCWSTGNSSEETAVSLPAVLRVAGELVPATEGDLNRLPRTSTSSGPHLFGTRDLCS